VFRSVIASDPPLSCAPPLPPPLHHPCRLLVISALWLALCVAPDVHAQSVEVAQDTSDSVEAQLDRARQLFEEGLAQVEIGNWVQAEETFRRVLALRSSPVVAYNLASALARLGRLIESAELLRAIARDPQVDAETREPAERLLAEIEPQIGSLTVRVVGSTQGLILRLGDRTLGAGERVQAISVDPGTHTVIAERDGKSLASEQVNIGGAAPLKVEVTLDLHDAPIQPPAPDLRVSKLPSEQPAAPRDDGADMWSSPWLWGGVAGVVLVAAGVIVVAAVAGGRETEAPVGGTTDPPIVRGRVVPMGGAP